MESLNGVRKASNVIPTECEDLPALDGRITVHYGSIRLCFSWTEIRCLSGQVIEKHGGASRDRTDDLIVANSLPCPRWRDIKEARMRLRGSVYEGLTYLPCPSTAFVRLFGGQ